MENPQEYILIAGDTASVGEIVDTFSTLEWGRERAIRGAKELDVVHTIYKLTPVFRVEVELIKNVKITIEPPDNICTECKNTLMYCSCSSRGARERGE